MNKFYGTLSVNNIEKVANLIHEILEGKTYIFTSSYEYKRYEPEVRPNQSLRNVVLGSPLNIYFAEDNSHAGFNFCDTYGVWGLSTSNQDGKYDADFNAPYVVINHDEIKITQRTGAGMIAHWNIRLQEE